MELFLEYLKAFVVGGAICAIGQVLIATVPLTGFGSLLAKGVKTAVQENGLLGALTGGFTASSAGIGAAVFFGLLVALIFKPGDKA